SNTKITVRPPPASHSFLLPRFLYNLNYFNGNKKGVSAMRRSPSASKILINTICSVLFFTITVSAAHAKQN
ncbi:MAG: hypothetical protein ABJA37_03180, partial [Ferruginibacter sp.]